MSGTSLLLADGHRMLLDGLVYPSTASFPHCWNCAQRAQSDRYCQAAAARCHCHGHHDVADQWH